MPNFMQLWFLDVQKKKKKKVARKVKMIRNHKMAETAILNLKVLFLRKL